MLARSFLPASALSISDAEQDALVKVLGMLERGEIVDRQFSMGSSAEPECGSPSCICGWARHVARKSGRRIFPAEWTTRADPLCDLFLMGHIGRETIGCTLSAYKATPEQAAHALSNYLTTGKPRWAEVLA